MHHLWLWEMLNLPGPKDGQPLLPQMEPRSISFPSYRWRKDEKRLKLWRFRPGCLSMVTERLMLPFLGVQGMSPGQSDRPGEDSHPGAYSFPRGPAGLVGGSVLGNMSSESR